ncbi:NAD-dependent epimerase/dehydratase family protein [Candidatus Woesearchaeota archaeon]|nr:NAD-dependent epimerase/dehydratase family protein [Candidatus Woesearchaeota archaeon]
MNEGIIDSLLVNEDETIEKGLGILNETGLGILILVDQDKKLKGIVSAGDLRRGLIKDNDINKKLKSIANFNPVTAHINSSKQELIELTEKRDIVGKLILVDDDNKVADIFIKFSELPVSIKGKELEKVFVNKNDSLKSVMKKIDLSGLGIGLIVDDNERLKGLVTDNDIREGILSGVSHEEPIGKIMNKNPVTGTENMDNEELIRLIPHNKFLKIPVLDKEARVTALKQVYNKGYYDYLSNYSTYKNKKINSVLVTGGAGYLGSVLVRKLLKRGYWVVVLDRLLYGKESLSELENHPNFRLVTGDVRHIEDITKSIRDVNAVIHLAGIVGDPACGLSPLKTIEQNYLATLNLAQICKYNQINRFIFASSCSVYGQGQDILTEDSELSPVSLYARDKINSEKGLFELTDENFSPTIMRMGTLYGFSHRPRFDLVLNILTALAIKKGEFSVFGGEQWRPLLHVKDAADAYIKVLEAPINKVKGEIFNVGSNEENYKIIEIGEKIKELIPSSKMNISLKDVDKRDYRVNFDKIKKELNFRTKLKAEQGILEIIEAFNSGKIDDFTNAIYNNSKFLDSILKNNEYH